MRFLGLLSQISLDFEFVFHILVYIFDIMGLSDLLPGCREFISYPIKIYDLAY